MAVCIVYCKCLWHRDAICLVKMKQDRKKSNDEAPFRIYIKLKKKQQPNTTTQRTYLQAEQKGGECSFFLKFFVYAYLKQKLML